MNAPSPARRVRGRFMNFSLWTSALAFFFIEGYALQDQLAIGHASIIFMLGTACFAAGACIGLFAIIAAIGFAVSAAFSDDPPLSNGTTSIRGGLQLSRSWNVRKEYE